MCHASDMHEHEMNSNTHCNPLGGESCLTHPVQDESQARVSCNTQGVHHSTIEYDPRPGSGIYAIQCAINGKVYIGQSVSMGRRRIVHFSSLRNGNHCNSHLQRAFASYGEAMFQFIIIEKVPPDMLDSREAFWIALFRSNEQGVGYNLSSGGNRNKVISPLVRKKISASLTGRPCSEATRIKISASNKGKPKSKAHCASIRAMMLRPDNPRIGQKRGQETRARMAAAQRGKKLSPEHKARISRALRGKPWTEARRMASKKGKA